MFQRIMTWLIVGAMLMGGMTAAAEETKPVVVGTYDSRAVALAYYHSDNARRLNEPVHAAQLRYDKAKAAGDKAAMEKIEQEMQHGQAKLHAKVFGSAPIPEVLEAIHDQLPGIAKEAGVDLLVSKWDVAYRKPEVKCVDVTMTLVMLFQPSEKTLKIVADIPKHTPLSEEEVDKMKCH
ncbi:MAG: hypothetical protein IT440_11940 [Phycisphaeraceae bacterium]|nr:hypothetical protein [Phycisphaeraceae bacterium]